MTWLLIILASVGVQRPEGHCLDQRSLVLTEHEFGVIAGRLARGAKAEQMLREVAPEKAALLNEAAGAYESAAFCAAVKAPECPACDCSEWLSGFAGAAVGAATCGGFWIGSRL